MHSPHLLCCWRHVKEASFDRFDGPMFSQRGSRDDVPAHPSQLRGQRYHLHFGFTRRSNIKGGDKDVLYSSEAINTFSTPHFIWFFHFSSAIRIKGVQRPKFAAVNTVHRSF